MLLEHLGWNDELAENFARQYGDEYCPARVSLEQRGLYMVMMERGELPAVPTGRLLYEAVDRSDLPVVGDWVAVRLFGDVDPMVTINGLLPRKSAVYRQEAGKRTRIQVLAANLDSLFLVIGLDGNFNLNRVERYLAQAWDSKAQPVILLTKADLRDDVEAVELEVKSCAHQVAVHAISGLTGFGIDALTPYLAEGKTVALLGSSGVGKSTLLNRLIGENVQRTLEVRDFDSKGRHATTHRQMFRLPSGALLIDTPGIREFRLWEAQEGVAETFDDIEKLARSCRFSNCLHNHEPGCAVIEALESGQLERSRLENYRKMRRELAYQERKLDINAARTANRRLKQISKSRKTIKDQ